MKLASITRQAFTLIELLIVIVIIGILATSLIPRLKGMQDKAKYTRVQKDFHDFRAIVLLAQTNTNKTLKDIVDDSDILHPDCYQDGVIMSDLRNLNVSHPCRVARRNALTKIEVAAGFPSGGLSYMELDPRGSPYGLDPNEEQGRAGYGPCDFKDILYTGGPDGNIFSAHSGLIHTLSLLPINCPGGY